MNEMKPLAIVTGASTGIGFELAKCCAKDGHDLVIAADEPRIHDAAGIIWPVSVAPFEAVVINLKVGDAASDEASGRLYRELGAAGVDALYDDRDQGAGGKFAAADLIGIPYQLIVGPRGLKTGEIEIKHRKTGERETLPLEQAVARLQGLIEPQRRNRV